MAKTTKGGSGHFMGLRSPMAAPMHGIVKKAGIPKIADNTMRPEIKTSAARVRSAQTGGKVVKPF
jgi:hypothetical protein